MNNAGKTTSRIYLVVSVEVEHDADMNVEDVAEELQSEADYSFKLENEYMKIESTEIVGTTESY
jgi:hypothetical protein